MGELFGIDTDVLSVVLAIIALVVGAVYFYFGHWRKKNEKNVKINLDFDKTRRIMNVDVKWHGKTDFEVVNEGDKVIIKPKKEK